MTSAAMGELIFYRSEGGAPALEVRLEQDTVWLSQQQIAELFQTTKQNVSIHMRNIFDEGELERNRTVKESLTVRREGSRDVRRSIEYYNLDLIISVGYRVKSNVATQFRIWATERLSEFLVQGYAINESRLEQLGTMVTILARADDELVAGVADVLAEYLPGLTLLRDYDNAQLNAEPNAVPGWTLTIEEARQIIQGVAVEFPDDSLLGNERGEALSGIVSTIYQGFDGQDLYPTAEEKAANLLYLVVKDHPLSDGNKRSAAALFVTFLARNGMLHGGSGVPRITNNALAATTLLVAMSDPKKRTSWWNCSSGC